MPPRLVSLAVVAFWVAATVWLVRRDVWPRVAPGEPPPIYIGTYDESTSNRPPVRWKVLRHAEGPGGRPEEYSLSTTFVQAGKDIELKAEMKPRRPRLEESRLFRFGKLSTTYLVSGNPFEVPRRMLGFRASVETSSPLGRLGGELSGDVADGVCTLHWEKKGAGPEDRGSAAFEVGTASGQVFLPLHPPERIADLSGGRRWTVRTLDPLLAVGTVVSSPEVGWVTAVVRRPPESLHWGKGERECWVIDLDGDSVRGAVWVDRDDNQVLRMEVRLGGDRWEVVRE